MTMELAFRYLARRRWSVSDDHVMNDYAVTISGEEREDGEKPYTYVVTADCYDLAVEYALHAHGPRFGLRLESVEMGVPPADCGYHWNDHRPAWRKKETAND